MRLLCVLSRSRSPYILTTNYKKFRTSVQCLTPFPAVDHHRKRLSHLSRTSHLWTRTTHVSLAPTNAIAQISHANSPVPALTYSGSPAPSDFSLPLHASHPHAQSQPIAYWILWLRRCRRRAPWRTLMSTWPRTLRGLPTSTSLWTWACPTSCPRCPHSRLTSPSRCSPMHSKATRLEKNTETRRF